jgi:SAM-dependent methyltransferase
MKGVEYDPTQFLGAAPYYLLGRPPYSVELGEVLASELGLDGTGSLLDVGCGPGTVGVQLASLFEHVAFLEPDTDLLAQAQLYATSAGLTAVSFLNATAEKLPELRLKPMRIVTFGQSFHRMNRLYVAKAVYDILEPGGSMVLVSHDATRQMPPQPAGVPPIPHDDINRLIQVFLGPERRSGSRSASSYGAERFEDTLASTSFEPVRVVFAKGRTDVIRDADGVIANYLSMSYAAPHLFGSRLDEFVAALRDLLKEQSPGGQFWDWPGDTEIEIATRS